MDTNSAKAKLDHVIEISRVEMYKPIQVAEVLRMARASRTIDLSNVETYRVQSRRWRDEVTQTLFQKRSTSSARFQDDVWNESAVPPAAMVALGSANAESGMVEAYVYSFVLDKSRELSQARSILTALKNVDDLEAVLAMFDAQTLTSSADRLFEILATAVFKTELGQTRYSISIDRPEGSTKGLSVDGLVDLVAEVPMPLAVDRLGHTNAADAGLDIWTNFGVAVNVKRRVLSSALLYQIYSDTPVGLLHIVCLDIDSGALATLRELTSTGRKISITTLSNLLSSVEKLLSGGSAKQFVYSLISAFDKEFPMARTLADFTMSRGYPAVELTGIWRR